MASCPAVARRARDASSIIRAASELERPRPRGLTWGRVG